MIFCRPRLRLDFPDLLVGNTVDEDFLSTTMQTTCEKEAASGLPKILRSLIFWGVLIGLGKRKGPVLAIKSTKTSPV